jgi:hypothetical protein
MSTTTVCSFQKLGRSRADDLPIRRQWAEGEDEQVEVNQRALIDKVLARYAAEFTGAYST